MSRAKTFLVLLTAVLTASCAAKFYTPDLSGPTAQIRFVADAPRFTILAAMADEQCGTTDNAGRITPLGGTFLRHEDMFARIHQRLGVPGGEDIPMDRMHEIKIPAEKDFVFIFSSKRGSVAADTLVGSSTAATCDLTLSFYPRRDQQYEAVYKFNGLVCSATLVRIDRTVTGEILRSKEDSFRRAGVQCRYPGGF